jgi:RNA polymerase sigma-70 factor (ECF subfamily)
VYNGSVSVTGGGADDHELVSRARRGDVAAYEELVRRYQGVATRVARSVAGADAEDVAQEAFVRAYHALDRFRDGASFRPWLLRIVVNLGRNATRAQARRELAAARTPVDRAPAFEDDVVLDDDHRALRDALGRLPPRDREVLTFRYLEGLSEAETSVALGCRVGTVKSRTSRALDRLRATIDSGTGSGVER